MSAEIKILLLTAASIGFFHTIFGPDHYLPFIMLSWARKWSAFKTFVITFLCGIGHIAGSVILGLVGVALGLAVGKLEIFESVRGNVAAWLLIAFGLAYSIWGIKRAFRSRSHSHEHLHTDSDIHSHTHVHFVENADIHTEKGKQPVTPWVLFIIFVFGPCEPLIPLLMYPAAKNSVIGMLLVTAVFGIVTISTMLATVLIAQKGVQLAKLNKFHRFTHAIAGATILLCGLSIQFLGL